MLDHLTGVISELSERSLAGEQLLGEILAVLEGVNGLVEDDGGSGEVLLLNSPDFHKQVDMLSELNELILSDSKLCRSLALLDVAVVELLVGSIQGLGGVTDLDNTEADF